MLVQPKHINDKHQVEEDEVVQAFKTLINYATNNMNVSESEKANFADTPVRAAKAFKDLVWPKTKIVEELTHILKTGFPLESTTEDTGIITQGPIKVESMCPHHMLRVSYEVFVSYKPMRGGTVLGLSKLARLSQTLGRRPILQEQLARDIADVLHHNNDNEKDIPQIASEGSAVQLLGKHSCMSCRGVKENAVTLSTELRGAFKKTSLKNEFYQAILSIRQAK